MSLIKKKTTVLARIFLGIILSFGILYTSTFFNMPRCTEISDIIKSLGFWSPIVYSLVYVFSTLLFIPGTILTLIAGMVFGSIQGSLIVIIAATSGASFAFLISRYLLRDAIESKLNHLDWFKKLSNLLIDNGLNFVIFVRLVPLFPFNGLNYACGLLPLSFRHFFVGSFLGMIPGTFAYVYLGETGCKVIDSVLERRINFSDFPEDIKFSLLLSFTLLAVLSILPLVIKKLLRK